MAKSDVCIGVKKPTKCCTDLYKDTKGKNKDKWIKSCITKSSTPKAEKKKTTTKKSTKTKKPVKTEETKIKRDKSGYEILPEWKQCTFDWAEKKAYDGRSLDILRVCGTKRVRDYAKCFDKDTSNEREKCIVDVQEKARNKRGANSPSFQCYTSFMTSCYKGLGKEEPKKKLIGKHETSKLNKPDFCRLEWKTQKKNFIKNKDLKPPIKTVKQCIIKV